MNITRIFTITVATVIMTAMSAGAQDINKGWTFCCQGRTCKVDLPHTWNVTEGLEDYAGKAVYSRDICLPEGARGKSIRIYFGAVYHDARVFLNDRLVGEHLNAGYTPFSFELADFADYQPGAVNRLKVEVNNSFSRYSLPYDHAFDWNNDGGIIRGVRLEIKEKPTVRYVHFTPQLDTACCHGTAHVEVKLNEDDVDRITPLLTVYDKTSGAEVYHGKKVKIRKKEGIFSWDIDCGKVIPWHFDNPHLYAYRLMVGENLYTGHIGFRSFGIKGCSFCLNGEEVRLPGIESMQGSNPDFGMAEPGSVMLETVRLMKELNCTITRFHWMQDEQLLCMMDSLGILVQEELPWWQKPGGNLTPELREAAQRQIEEMVEAHYNHPCIFAWGMSNEVGGNQQEIESLADFTRRLDGSRIIDASCNFINRNLGKDPSLKLDLPTWNEYVGTWNGTRREDLPMHLKNIGAALDGRPLFITEAGLCEPAFVGGDLRRIDDMIYHISEWQKTPFICGYIYFCLQDYRTHMGEEGLGRYRLRRHGVTDCRFNRKPSFSVLRSLMSPVEITSVKPVSAKINEGSLAQAWSADSGDSDIEVGIRVKNSLPSYSLQGYSVKYEDINGNEVVTGLDDLAPGQECSVVLKDINSSYHFSVCRPDGSEVAEY